jgi:ubiquinol-cytochrome c reductase cytochrome c1 subunit
MVVFQYMRSAFARSSPQLNQNTTRSAALTWLAKTAAVSGLVGLTVSNTILDSEKMSQWSSTFLSKLVTMGLLPEAAAFSTADNGLHAPHYPWTFHKFWKTYDHAA